MSKKVHTHKDRLHFAIDLILPRNTFSDIPTFYTCNPWYGSFAAFHHLEHPGLQYEIEMLSSS
jgi:hypothetical protein